MTAPRTTEAAIVRALSAWKTVTKKEPGAIEIAPDGTIRIMAAVDRPEPEVQPAKPKKWSAG